MSFISNLFGKSKKNLPDSLSPGTPNDKPSPEPARGGTTLRKQEDAPPQHEHKAGPELSALEMAERQKWEVKTLPVWKPGDEILGLYRVEDVLEGGMGRVYIAQHKGWNVKLAIKSPNELMLSDRNNFARVLREANSWIELGLHPNIAYCYYVRSIEEVPHIFVEYVDGGNLRQWIAEGKCIDYRIGLDLAIQFCHGMEHAHSKGMIHRDIKPENVLMTKDGALKITDFGLVRSGAVIGGEKGKAGVSGKGMTRIGDVMGTEGFMAPEQFEDAAGVDVRADIFSFGVCLYEMFCGHRPYPVTYGNPQDAPDPVTFIRNKSFPTDLARVLTRCVQWEPMNRYSGVREIREQLVKIYSKMHGEQSIYDKIELPDLEASGLNNRAVSLLELGKEQTAFDYWNKALDLNPIHFESNLNLGYYRWRKAEINDDILFEIIEKVKPFLKSQMYICKFIEISIERGCPIHVVPGILNKEIMSIESSDSSSILFRKDLIQLKEKVENLLEKKAVPVLGFLGTFKGHNGPVRCADFSSDGNHIISGGKEGSVRLWDARSMECISVFEGHSDEVHGVKFLKGDKQIVSGSYDMTIKLWDVDSNECIRTLIGHDSEISSLAAINDRKKILSASYDSTIKLWNINNGKCLNTYTGHERGVKCIALSPDHKSFLSVSFDNNIKLWEIDSAKCIKNIMIRGEQVNSAAFYSDDKYLVIGDNGGQVYLVDIDTGLPSKTFKGHIGSVSSVACSFNGKFILSGGKSKVHRSTDHSIKLWETETRMSRCTLTDYSNHKHDIHSVYFSSNGAYILSCSKDCTMKLWGAFYPDDFNPMFSPLLSKPVDYHIYAKLKRSTENICNNANSLIKINHYKEAHDHLRAFQSKYSFVQDEVRALISICGNKGGNRDELNSVWNCYTYRHKKQVWDVIFLADGKHALSSSIDGEIRILNVDEKVNHLFAHLKPGRIMMASSSDKKSIAMINWSEPGILYLWDFNGEESRSIKFYTDSVAISLSFSGDNKLIACGCDDGAIKFIEVETGEIISGIEAHDGWITQISFFKNDRYILSRSRQDQTIKCWDVHNLKNMAIYETTDKVFCIHPNQKQLITGLSDLKVLDIKTGKYTGKYNQSDQLSEVDSITISNDGRFLLSSHREPFVRLWNNISKIPSTVLKGHHDSVPAVRFSPDARYAISGSWDHTVRLWEFDWNWKFNS